jgi:hypothetical protein
MEQKIEIPPIDLTPPAAPAPLIETEVVTPIGVDHTARTHHKNSPSKLPYLDLCCGFTSDETGDKDAAEKGTQLHEYMDEILARYIKEPSKALLVHLNEYCQSITIDEADRGLLVFCVRVLNKYIAGAASVVHEIRVTIHRGDGRVLTSGHLDVLLIYANGAGLLIDYKFGWLPVKHASINEQGIAYALGVFEKYNDLKVLGVMFVQPRLGTTTEVVIKREQIPQLLEKLAIIIERAEWFQRQGFTQETIPMLRTGSQCLYCKHTVEGTCPARLAVLSKVAEAAQPSLLPSHIDITAIDTPEKAALARYWVETVEDFLEPVKKRAKEMATLSPDRKISVTLADGTPVAYKIQDKKFDRSLGDTIEIRDAVKDFVTEQQLLACASLSWGKLESIGADAILEATNGAEERELQALDEKHRILLASTPPKITKSAAQKERAAVRARYKEQRITKEQAKEQFATLLTAKGLLTRPDGTTPTLVRDKSVGKQLPSSTK